MIFRIIHWASRLALAAIFLYSGYVKIQSPLQFAADIMGYQLVPAGLVFPVAQYFPYLEIALGLLLLIGWRVRYWGIAASALIVFFITILSITYARGIDANCGCFGTGDKISPLTILRDSLILLPALYLALENRIRSRQAAPRGGLTVGMEAR
jgi:putative oxidoreductase